MYTWRKQIIIIVIAVVVTTLGISASDTLQGVSGSLLGQLVSDEQNNPGGCPLGMLAVPMSSTIKCVDIYEASTHQDCQISSIQSQTDTESNVLNSNCKVVSKKDAEPWTFVTREQARELCIRSGKRLPTAEEWYTFSIGTPKNACEIDGNRAVLTGSALECKSALGVHDTVGNVWEWIAGDVINAMYQGRELPKEGFVAQVAEDGIAVMTTDLINESQDNGFFWMSPVGAYGILRGGFYGSANDAGVYATQAKTITTLTTPAIGFRCVI